MTSLYQETVSAICGSLVADFFHREGSAPLPASSLIVQFVIAQHAAAPFWVRAPLHALTLLFAWHSLLKTGHFFHRCGREKRAAHLRAWKEARLGTRRQLVRFYESLAVLPAFRAAC